MAEAQQGAQHTERDDRIPMPVFSAGERFKESVYAIGDVTLFRPMSFVELMVGIPLCALFSYLVVYPLTQGTTAFAVFVVLVYFAPKALVLLEAKAGRPLAAEATATVRFAWIKLWRRDLYQGVQCLGREHRYQRIRLKQMLEAEARAHQELAEDHKRPGEE